MKMRNEGLGGIGDGGTQVIGDGGSGFIRTTALSSVVAVLLSACAHVPVAPPEPVIRTVEVRVPVPIPCPGLQQIGPEPSYPDIAAALIAAPDLASRVGLLLAGRVLRDARLRAQHEALIACSTEGPHP